MEELTIAEKLKLCFRLQLCALGCTANAKTASLARIPSTTCDLRTKLEGELRMCLQLTAEQPSETEA